MQELEQPLLDENSICDVAQDFDGEQNNAQTENTEQTSRDNVLGEEENSQKQGSNNNYLGKFNSVQDLENAYNSLQAEFTRKCQKLKSLEEEIEAGKANKEENHNTQLQAEFACEDFSEKVNNFLSENPNAKKYAKEISLEIIKDNSLTLMQAYNKVLAGMYREPEELLKDKNFIENYILNDDYLKKELIKKYIKDVKESSSPTLISGTSGLGGGRAKNIEISSLEEANKLALKMFRS